MAKVFDRQFSRGSCRVSAWVLAFSFLFGLVSGVLACCGCGPEFASLMRGLPSDTVSIVGLILCLTFPFLLSFTSWVLNPWLLFPVCFCRAFLFGLVHGGIVLFWDAGGWLLRWLIIFSDCLSLPLLYCFWLSCLGNRVFFRRIFVSLTLIMIIGTVDFYLIWPKLGAFLSLQKG